MKYWIAGFVIGVCLIFSQLRLRSQNNAAAVAAPETLSFRVAFGFSDKQPSKWDGSLQASGGRISKVEGWRFIPSDSLQHQSWKAATEPARPGTAAGCVPAVDE